MELFEAIARRHSYREGFTEAPVPREDLVKIVQAGIQAPSGKNEQTTSFVIVDDRELLAQIAAIVDRPFCQSARAVIACVIDPRPVLGTFSFALEDCSAAVENMLLAITALGYATVWVEGMFCNPAVAAKVDQLLGVPAGKSVRVLLPLGIASQSGKPKEKLPFDRRAWFNRYGAP